MTKIEKLKQILDEIKNLALNECERECKWQYCQGSTDETTCVIYKIKNKIDEVLNAGQI